MKRPHPKKRQLVILVLAIAGIVCGSAVSSARATDWIQIQGHGKVSQVGGLAVTCSTPRTATNSSLSDYSTCQTTDGGRVQLHASVVDSADGWTFVGWQGFSPVPPDCCTWAPVHCDGANASDFLPGPGDCFFWDTSFTPVNQYVRAIFRDTAAPNTTIDSGPAAGSTTSSTSATFSFTTSSGQPGVVFECKLDAAAYGACSSPMPYSGLAGGSHTFLVRAKDPSGNTDSTPATRTWNVDVTPPTTTITAGPSGPTASTSASFSFTSGESGATFQCSLNGSGYLACASPKTYIRLADGAYHFAVRARDAVGNVDLSPATRDWIVDTAAPDTVLDSGPLGTSNGSVSFSFHSNEAGVSFWCTLDAGNPSLCTSPAGFTGLASGIHTVAIRAVDPAGNGDPSPASRTWTVDADPPDTVIDSGPSGVSGPSVQFAFHATESGSLLRCSLDGAAWVVCASPRSYVGLSGGSHTFATFAVDAAGNNDPTPAVRSWTVDATAPETTITSGPPDPTASTEATFQFSSNDADADFECKLDAGTFASCATPQTYSGLSPGAHTFSVRAMDGFGNVDSSPSTATWTVDMRDGLGRMSVAPAYVRSGSTANTLRFTYTAAVALANGAISLTVPSGWSAPSTVAANPGYVTSTSGTLTISGRTITVGNLTTGVGATVDLVYGPTSAGGPGAAAPGSGAVQTWLAKERSTGGGTLTTLSSGSPVVDVLARDGTGTMTVNPAQVRSGSTGTTLTFVYTATAGGTAGGTVEVIVPNGWSAPSSSPTAPGYATAGAGSASISGRTISVSNLDLAGGAKLAIVYGSKSAGGPGASAPTSGATQTWLASERSSTAGTSTVLATSPAVLVLAPDGSGTIATPTTSVVRSSSGNTITFTYTAAGGGVAGGTVAVDVPAGWSVPSTTATAAGSLTASAGTVSVSGQTIKVSNLTLAAGATVTITYGSRAGGGAGATAPAAVGSQSWLTRERSSPGGTLTALAASPAISVT